VVSTGAIGKPQEIKRDAHEFEHGFAVEGGLPAGAAVLDADLLVGADLEQVITLRQVAQRCGVRAFEVEIPDAVGDVVVVLSARRWPVQDPVPILVTGRQLPPDLDGVLDRGQPLVPPPGVGQIDREVVQRHREAVSRSCAWAARLCQQDQGPVTMPERPRPGAIPGIPDSDGRPAAVAGRSCRRRGRRTVRRCRIHPAGVG